jgi:hypothetical protein
LDARRRGVKGILELVLLNKRVSTIDILFHTDEEAPLQTNRLRILDSIVLFAAAAVAASGYPKTQPTNVVEGLESRTFHDSFGARLLKPMRSWKSSNEKLDCF